MDTLVHPNTSPSSKAAWTPTAINGPKIDDNWPCPDLEACSYHRRPSWQEQEQLQLQVDLALDRADRPSPQHTSRQSSPSPSSPARIHNPFALSLRSLPPRISSPAASSKAAPSLATPQPSAASTATASALKIPQPHQHPRRITFLSPFEASFSSLAAPAIESPLSPFCLPGSPFTDMESLASSSPGLPTPSSIASMNPGSPCYCHGPSASSPSIAPPRANSQQSADCTFDSSLSFAATSGQTRHSQQYLSSSPPSRVQFAGRSPSYQPTMLSTAEPSSQNSENALHLQTADSLPYRRRSVDVGTLSNARGHQRYGRTSQADAPAAAFVPPDQLKAHRARKSNNQRHKEFLFAQQLTSILRHSLSLCSIVAPDADIEAWSNATSPRSSISSNSSFGLSSISDRLEAPTPSHRSNVPRRLRLPSLPYIVPSRRLELINMISNWSFDANQLDLDELCECACMIFECFLDSEGLSKDAGTPARWRTFLISLRAAYHPQNAYHNFAHAVDVLQACYSFLTHIGVAPPISRLQEQSLDSTSRKTWKRKDGLNEIGHIGDILRPMDVLALLVAAIGHDIGHPGLTNAYMINARTPAAQVYNDKSVLENFHSVTLIRMLKLHGFGSLLEESTSVPLSTASSISSPSTTPTGDHSHATDFRQVLLTSILVTDMSRHFPFVEKLTQLGERLAENGYISTQVSEDRLLICSALMKCGDISNPSRPHPVASSWSSALLEEWAVQAEIEAKFDLPISVVTIKNDTDERISQAKSQVGFINLFTQPLFDKLAAAVPSFQLFATHCSAGRTPWEAIIREDEERKLNRDIESEEVPAPCTSISDAQPQSALSRALASASPPNSSLAHIQLPEYRPAPHRSPWSAKKTDFTFDSSSVPLSPCTASVLSTSPSTTSSLFKDGRSSPTSSATTFSTSSWIPSNAVDAYHPLAEEACTDNCSSITALCASCARRQAKQWNDDDVENNSTATVTSITTTVDALVNSGQWPPEPFRPTPQAKSVKTDNQ